MALEVLASSNRLVVTVGWDKTTIDGEFVKVYCVNPATGDVSETGVSKNDGQAIVTYPEGYTGATEVTVTDNHENSDTGVLVVGDDEAVVVDPDAHPEHPIVLPPEPPIDWDAHPEHPIVLPPDLPPGFWTGNLPPSEKPPDEFPVPN